MYSNSIYGESIYSEDTASNVDIDALSPDLMRFLPPYYQHSKAIREIMRVEAEQLGLLYFYLKDIEKQFILDTATWGLSGYEKDLGLVTNINLSLEDRREMIKAKWRSSGTTTKAMIKSVAEAFSGGEVEIIEYPLESRIVVKFVGIRGIPKNMQNFISTLEGIMPAHIGYEFKYTYTNWEIVRNLTWLQASSRTWDELRIYEEG